MNIWTLSGALIAVYCVLLAAGYIAGRGGGLDEALARKVSPYLADPLTRHLKGVLHRDFREHISAGRDGWVFGIIFLNNLLLSAVITKTLYGVIFFLPIILVLWGGFWRGVIYARIGLMHFLNPIGLCEFGAYLLAAACGVRFGLAVTSQLLPGLQLVEVTPDLAACFAQLYPVVVLLLAAGAALETALLRRIRRSGDFSARDEGAHREEA
jgi:uncharacterized membrane protein SpoIIM required for sporulation